MNLPSGVGAATCRKLALDQRLGRQTTQTPSVGFGRSSSTAPSVQAEDDEVPNQLRGGRLWRLAQKQGVGPRRLLYGVDLELVLACSEVVETLCPALGGIQIR